MSRLYRIYFIARVSIWLHFVKQQVVSSHIFFFFTLENKNFYYDVIQIHLIGYGKKFFSLLFV